MANTRQQGQRWEQVAEKMLRRRGLRPVARNYHCRCGEIDLIMLDTSVLVFVEVRYRHSDRYCAIGTATVTAAEPTASRRPSSAGSSAPRNSS
jgi:putative endonuclease